MTKKVLVVDDDPDTVRFLTLALEEHGYEAVTARDGKEGFERATAELPDLILLDVMMPKRTGFTLFRQLRKSKGLESVPVIMLTGVAAALGEQDDLAGETEENPYAGLRESLRKTIAQMKEEGVVRPDAFIDKPIDPKVVMAKIKELIGT